MTELLQQEQTALGSRNRPAAVVIYLVQLMLLVIPVIVIPEVATSTPAVHSKELALRFLLGCLGVMGAMAVTRRWIHPPDFADAALLAFPLAHLVSALFSTHRGYCFQETWHMWAVALLPWLLYRILPRTTDLAKITAITGLAGVLCALYGLLAYAGLDVLKPIYSFSFSEDQGGRNYIHSFLGNPEYFGGYAAPVAALCFSRVFDAGARVGYRAAWIGITLMLLLALVLTGSRGAFLGFLVAAAIIVIWQFPALPATLRKATGWLLAGCCVLGAVGVLVLSTANPINRRDMQLAQRFADLFNLQSASIRERLLFYTLSARAIQENPILGAGPGTFGLNFFPSLEKLEAEDPHAGVSMMARELQNRIAEHAHNDYLEFWCDLGTIGFGALLILQLTALVRFLNRPGPPGFLMSNVASRLAVYRTGFFATAACLFINAAFSFPLHMPARASLAWIATGCFFAADKRLRLLAELTPVSVREPET